MRNETSQAIDWRSEKLGSQIIDGGPGWIRAASQDPLTANLGLIGT